MKPYSSPTLPPSHFRSPGEAEAGYITRISRSCINDANFDTYSEVTLQCHIGGENYNLLQAASTLPASAQAAEDLDIPEGSPNKNKVADLVDLGAAVLAERRVLFAH